MAVKPCSDDVAEHLLKGKAVLLEHGEQETRHHQADHQEQGRTVPNVGAGEQVKRDADTARYGKQISWRFVRLKASLVLMRLKSFGTGT